MLETLSAVKMIAMLVGFLLCLKSGVLLSDCYVSGLPSMLETLSAVK